MIVDDLVKRPGSWLSMRRDTGVIVSSRIRLARNLQGRPFPGWATEADRVAIGAELTAVFRSMPELADARYFDMGTISPVDREVLQERHLISRDFSERGPGSALVLSHGEQIAIMVNEEDHLRLQAFSPGLGLAALLKRLNALDSAIEARVRYAFSARLGYLTACPSNVGTGLRASVMMHLSGLRIMEEVDPVIKGLDRLGIAVRGLLGEGTDAYGNLFQISNQTTLGETERDIVKRLISLVAEVAQHEENARARLWEGRRNRLMDYVSRSLGVLMSARLLSSREAIDLLSGLRLGVDFDVVENLTVTQINEIMLMTQPGHLQKMIGKAIASDDRDEFRARLVQKRLARVRVVG